MSNERPIKKPGRSGAAFRSGPMVENPGKMLGRLMGYIFKNYRIPPFPDWLLIRITSAS